MIIDHFKCNSRPKETHCFLGTEKEPAACRPCPYKTHVVVLSVLFLAVLVVTSYTTFKVYQLENEVKELRTYAEDNNEFFKYIQRLQNQEIYTEDTEDDENDTEYVKDGSLDTDYGLYYDDDNSVPSATENDNLENGSLENINLEKDFETQANPDEDNLEEELLNGGDFTKPAESRRRLKRNVVASTADGVPIISSAYADAKKINRTNTLNLYSKIMPKGGDGVHTSIPKLTQEYQSPSWRKHHSRDQGLRHYVEMVSTSTKFPPVLARKSRVMHFEDKSKAFRRVVKKSELKSLEHHTEKNIQQQVLPPEVTVFRENPGRRHKQRKNLETMGERHLRRKPLPTIHFSGDTSKYVYGQHENYNGNGHLLHPNRVFVDWTANDWVSNLGMDRHFDFDEGTLTVKEPGLYFVYAQIYYIDEHDTSGYIVYKNEEPILQCTTMTHSHVPVNKTNTCFTAGAEYFEENDKISIEDLHSRYSVFQRGKSFFGAIKLGDIKVK